MTAIHEHYGDYRAPRWIRRTVRRLLASLAPQHVGGLAAIVLTESAVMPKGRTHRIKGKRHDLKASLGFYRRKRPGDEPAVFLVVDKILAQAPPMAWRLPFVRDVAVGNVLYHEVGHHLNAHVGTMAGGEEASAEEWRRRLMRVHWRRQYWYLWAIRRPLGLGVRWLLRLRSRRMGHHAVKPGNRLS